MCRSLDIRTWRETFRIENIRIEILKVASAIRIFRQQSVFQRTIMETRYALAGEQTHGCFPVPNAGEIPCALRILRTTAPADSLIRAPGKS